MILLSSQGRKKLSLLIVLAFVLTMVVPGMALAATSVPVVTPTDYTENTNANYTVTFDTYNQLTTAASVYIGFYNGTTLVPAGYSTVSAVYVNNASVTTFTYGTNYLKIPVPNQLEVNASVTLKVYGLTNPAVGTYKLGLYSTADATVVASTYLTYNQLNTQNNNTTPGTSSGGSSSGGSDSSSSSGTSSQTVSSNTGATVSSSDGSVSVVVPAGAVTGAGTVTVSEVSESQAPAATAGTVVLQLGSKVYEVKISGAQLNGNVTLTFAYDKNKFASVPAEQIGLYYFNEDRGGWVFVGGDVDTASGKVSAEVNHFTKFAIMANPNLPVLSDVASHWAGKDIKRLVGMLAIGGYPDKTFKPDNNITRNEFAVILAKALNWKANAAAADKFSDSISIPEWSKGFVGAAVDKGVISGYTDGTFGGDRLVTRSEIAAMVVKALGKNASTSELTFADAANAPDWAKGFIATAVSEGIVKGKPGNFFEPNDNATRAESSTMIVRVLNNLKI